MKATHRNPLLRNFVLAATIVLSLGATASAATYQWTGATDSDWTKATNWPAASGITVGPPPVSGAHRIQIKNGANSEAVYGSALGTRTYGGSNIKGLVIGNPGNGRMRITGGKFVTQGTTTTTDLTAGVDVVGNASGIAEFIIDGGGNTKAAFWASRSVLVTVRLPASRSTMAPSPPSAPSITTPPKPPPPSTAAARWRSTKSPVAPEHRATSISTAARSKPAQTKPHSSPVSAPSTSTAPARSSTPRTSRHSRRSPSGVNVTIGNVLKDGGGGGGLN